MTVSGVVLYLLAVAIAFVFWRKVRGRSLDDLLVRSGERHRRVHRVLARHPGGGTWQEFRAWMREDE